MTRHANRRNWHDGLGESRCAQCNYELTAATIAHGEDAKPQPGDTSICLNCGQLHTYQANLTVQRITPQELRRLMSDREAWATVEKAQLFIQRRGRFR